MSWRSDLVPFGITICGLEELPSFAPLGVTHVLSILDPSEPTPPAFSAYPAHARLELRFNDIIDSRPGETPPSAADVDLLLAFGRDLLAEPGRAGHLLVHCHAGISRSTASMLLLLAQACPGYPETAIMGEILRIRPKAWPNLRIVKFGDSLLKRDGALIEAARDAYAKQLAQRPELASYFREIGRGEELEGLV